MEQLLTEREVAKILRVSVQSVRRLRYNNTLPDVKVGAAVRYHPDDLRAYVNKQRPAVTLTQ